MSDQKPKLSIDWHRVLTILYALALLTAIIIF